MNATLISIGVMLVLAWGETILSWNWYSRPRSREGEHPWGELEWRLLGLGIITPLWAWRAWVFWS